MGRELLSAQHARLPAFLAQWSRASACQAEGHRFKSGRRRLMDTKTNTRPGWSEYWLGVAQAVSARADCSRRRVGAILVDEQNRLVSTGYNGSPPGGPSCLAGECPRGQHFRSAVPALRDFCACGKWWPCPEAVEPGSSYDTGAGVCIANHAEGNCLLWADPSRMRGATLFVTEEPCGGCSRLIAGVGIVRVVVAPKV